MKQKLFTLILICLCSISTSFSFAAESRVLYSESFASGQGQFTIINTDLPADWTYVWKYDSRYGMVASAYYNGANYKAESWLISPEVDLSRCGSAYCIYQHAAKFQNGGENRGVTVWAANNPTPGEIIIDEWSQLEVPSYPVAGTWNFSSTSQISLQNFVGQKNVKIAIRYNSTTSAADTYEMKDFEVVGLIGETFTIEAKAADPSTGTVIGGGTYIEGTSVTLTAKPNAGYNFSHWDNGNTNPTITFNVTENAVYIAHFVEAETLSVRQALALGKTLSEKAITTESYYVYGIADNVKIDTTYGSATFTLCSGIGWGDTMTVFRAKALDGASFRFFGQLQDGDDIKLLTKIQNYDHYYVFVEDMDDVIHGEANWMRVDYDEEDRVRCNIIDSYYNSYGITCFFNEYDNVNCPAKEIWKVELVQGYIVEQSEQYVYSEGVVYGASKGVTNLFKAGETVIVKDTVIVANQDVPVTKICKNAFADAQIKKVLLPESIMEVGENAFKGCSQISTFISLSENPPTAYSSSFSGISNFICTLYVPAKSIEQYKNAEGWKTFQYIEPLKDCNVNVSYDTEKGRVEGAGKYIMGDKVTLLAEPQIGYKFQNWNNKETKNPYSFTIIEDVTISATFVTVDATPVDVEQLTISEITENTAEVRWPSVSGAATYELVIKDKTGNVICTLIFNANGQLTSIVLGAPARGNAQQRTQTTGFAFTITGLEEGTEYDLTIIAKSNSGATLDVKDISFRTNGVNAINQVQPSDSHTTKLLRNGQILILRGDKTYTLQGQEVR